MIDLHTHSTFSDGCLSPESLVALARKEHVTAVALTDHDTTGGVELFLKACLVHGIRGVGGVELSADIGKGTLHILGYFFRTDDRSLQDMLRKIRAGRDERNAVILEKLNRLGCELTWAEVRLLAAEDVVGRPHFAQALLARGYIRNRDEAFDRFLAKGKPAYVERYRLPPGESIRAIRGAGGVPVLAHPSTLQCSAAEMRRMVAGWVDEGLGGIEVYYSEHKAAQVRHYLSLVKEFGLVATGGSDFHGETSVPGLRLGRGFGSLRIPDDVVDKLAAACSTGGGS
jgi:predicted metal-dependent phosphoesterase TrpH